MNTQEIENQIENFRIENEIPGIAVSLVQNNNIVYQNGFGYRDILNKLPVTSKTIWPIASITKSFTSVSALQLAQQKKLDLFKPIIEYLPYFSVSDEYATKLINTDLFLKHASGLGRTGHQDKYREENYNPLIIRPQTNREHNIFPTRKSLVENLYSAKLQSYPGKFFSYCNEGYATVGHLIETLSKVNLEDYFSEYIFSNLEMKNTYTDFDSWRESADRTYLYSDKNNSPFYTGIDHEHFSVLELSKDYKTFLSAGGISTTANDLSLYQIQTMNFEDSKLNLNSEWLNKMQNINMPFGKSGWGYGYGYWVSYADDLKIIKHSGGLPGVSTFSMMIPSEKSGVVVLINKNEVKASNLAEMIFNIMRGKIYRNKLDEPLKFNIDYHNNNVNLFKEFVGKYEFRQGISEVAISDGNLCISTPSRLEATPETLILVSVGKDTFMNLFDGNSVSFVRDENGSVSHFLNGGYSYIKI